MTPAMQQYLTIKNEYPDCIILFRMGDFYETFYEDAHEVSKILNIALTARDKEKSIPMAGIPYHTLDNYLPKLTKANKRVVVVEQMENPAQAKGVVKREVTRIVTPGTDILLEDKKTNSYILVLHVVNEKDCLLAYADITQNSIFLVYCQSYDECKESIYRINPQEILIFEENEKIKNFIQKYIINLADRIFGHIGKNQDISKFVNTHILEKINKLDSQAQKAVITLLEYLYTTQRSALIHITDIEEIKLKEYMYLDSICLKNLEILESFSQKGISLFTIIDRTVTTNGSKTLIEWLKKPLQDIKQIKKRQRDITDFRTLGIDGIKQIQNILKQTSNLSRLASKIGMKNINPKEAKSIEISCIETYKLVKFISQNNEFLYQSGIEQINKILNNLKGIIIKISNTIVDEPPQNIRDNRCIKPGIDVELDELYEIKNNDSNWLYSYEKELINKTQITSLKVRYNKVFGYYIEIPKQKSENVPAYFVRKQTLVNAERFITPELKEYENKLLTADEKIREIENKIFSNLIIELQNYIGELQDLSNELALIDVYSALALLSLENDWTLPLITDENKIEIINGWHPVVEHTLRKENKIFVKNSFLANEKDRFFLITGPNMGGKSTYIRMVAIIVILAHIGSYVPASEATIGLTDGVFSRIGASDNLSEGQSTFLVEMLETANVIKNSSKRSLIILDEVGRGTATFDGMSLAWGISEKLIEKKGIVLFATHYHELTELANKYPSVKNLYVKVIERNNEVIFMHEVAPGKADKSYGIHVAKIAGIPDDVINKAEKVLKKLEKQENLLAPMPLSLIDAIDNEVIEKQDKKYDELKELIMNLEIEKLSPIQAWEILNRIKNLLQE